MRFKKGDKVTLKDPSYTRYGAFARNGKILTISVRRENGRVYGFEENNDGSHAHWLNVETMFKLVAVTNWRKELR